MFTSNVETQVKTVLIDLGNDFFIVKLTRREEDERALSEGPSIIGDNYLHVKYWRPNFTVGSGTITSLPFWIWFPSLSEEYHSEGWLRRVGAQIGRTIKLNNTTLATSRSKFKRVRIEVDLHESFACQI